MSEYWVSKKKYFCKYCDIYIADDAPSRQHHENGMRHKGSVERFIRGIYKSGEKQKKDLEEEKREMKRVEQAASAAFAQDVGLGLAKPAAPVASTSTAPSKKPTAKPSNPFANYSTAESLGYTDPDAERIAAEIELRRSQGIAGEWQAITLPQPPITSSTPTPGTTDPLSPLESSEGVKREAEAPPDEEDTRAFKLRKKTIVTGLGEIYDPGFIPIKIKKKAEPEEPKVGPSGITKIKDPEPSALKWAPMQWKRPGEPAKESREFDSTRNADPIKQEESITPGLQTVESSGSSKWVKPQWSEPIADIKQEDRPSIFGADEQTSSETKPGVKTEPDVKSHPPLPVDEPPTSSSGLFKKRKTPAGASRGRRDI